MPFQDHKSKNLPIRRPFPGGEGNTPFPHSTPIGASSPQTLNSRWRICLGCVRYAMHLFCRMSTLSAAAALRAEASCKERRHCPSIINVRHSRIAWLKGRGSHSQHCSLTPQLCGPRVGAHFSLHMAQLKWHSGNGMPLLVLRHLVSLRVSTTLQYCWIVNRCRSSSPLIFWLVPKAMTLDDLELL